jgi:uncharacterized protein (TIGR02001 family)
MRKSILSLSVAAALLAPALASAQTPAPSPLTGNFGFFSEYVFRGLTQTDGKPAIQGGFDYAHSSGAYMGTWASNISWLNDSPTFTGYTSSSLEWDFYGGYKGAIVGDLGFDVGLLYYYYPGRFIQPVGVDVRKADTLEGYGALTWKWLSAKVSYSLLDRTFGVPSSRGTYYLDLTGTYPVTDKLNLIAHYGMSKFSGSSAACTSGDNDTCASYDDYKLGVTYALPQSFTVGAAYTGTSMDTAQEVFYTNAAGRRLGDSTLTLFLQKTF